MKAWPGVFLIIFSTLAYYVPVSIAGLQGFDVSLVPARFYQYYCWMFAGALSLNIVYAGFLFYFVPTKKLFLKIVVCYLAAAESYTLFYHVVNKFYLQNGFNMVGMVATLIIFSICCTFIIFRAIKKQKTDLFEPSKTYVVRHQPKNNIGIINYIIRAVGHKSIYQNGSIYHFRKKTGTVTKTAVNYRYFENPEVSLKQVKYIKDIDNYIGKRFGLLKFNCNTLVKHATETKS